MPLANKQKLHAKQHFQTKNSKGYVRFGVEPDVISLTLHELEYHIRKAKQLRRQRKQDQGIDFDPNIYVYKGMREGASDLYGVYRLTDDGFNRVGDWEAA